MNYSFSISDILLSLHTVQKIKVTEDFLPFASEGVPDYVCQFTIVDDFPKELSDAISSDVIYSEGIMDIYSYSEKEFIRGYHSNNGNGDVYAIRLADYENQIIHIFVKRPGLEYINESANSFFHLAIEELLLRKNRMIFHSSLVDSPYGGILFTGKSGIGKSTQADLWVKYCGSRIINGDRTILNRCNDKWYGYGSPYAGSSQYYVNEGIPVKSIVSLAQGKDEKIERLHGMEAFRTIYEGITINTWNATFVDRVCNLVDKLLKDIPVYRFTCTPTEKAVDYLSKVMEGGV